MPIPDRSPNPTWWILAGLSVEDWTPSEERWFTLERRKLRATLPRAAFNRLDGIVVDWNAREDVHLLKTVRPGDRIVTIVRHSPRRWVAEPPAILRAKDTYWWPSMRRTSMLIIERPMGLASRPLADVTKALAEARLALRYAGRVSHPITSPRAIAALSDLLGSPPADPNLPPP